MMDLMVQQHRPKNLPDRHWTAGEEHDLPVQVGPSQFLDPLHGVLMDTFKARSQTLDSPWPFHPRRPGAHLEYTPFDAIRHVRLGFCQVPSQLAQRPSARV